MINLTIEEAKDILHYWRLVDDEIGFGDDDNYKHHRKLYNKLTAAIEGGQVVKENLTTEIKNCQSCAALKCENRNLDFVSKINCYSWQQAEPQKTVDDCEACAGYELGHPHCRQCKRYHNHADLFTPIHAEIKTCNNCGNFGIMKTFDCVRSDKETFCTKWQPREVKTCGECAFFDYEGETSEGICTWEKDSNDKACENFKGV